MKYSPGVVSCLWFGGVLLCLLCMGLAYHRAMSTPASGGGEWHGLNRFPWAIVIFHLGVVESLLSFIGFCCGLAGLFQPKGRKATAVIGVILNGLGLLPV